VLTRGNRKLGNDLIWSFSLPSGTPETCPGMTSTCRSHCYAVALEEYRPAVAAAYQRNLALSRRRDFARRVRAFLIAHAVRIVRIHVGGDFSSPRYAHAWLRIIRRSPRVRFFLYTRSWRVAPIKHVIDRMARLSNCRVWYSADSSSGVPTDVPARVRVAWLATTPDEIPTPGAHLVFRTRQLRSLPVLPGGTTVCPAEIGKPRSNPVTCECCGYCWRPDPVRRMALHVIDTPSERRSV